LTIELRRRTLSSGRFDTPEFIAANDVFDREFLLRTPPEQRHLPLCDSTPVRFNAALYEHMWGPSEFVSTGTLRDYDRIQRLPELRLPVMFLVGEFDEAHRRKVRQAPDVVGGSDEAIRRGGR
jgi:proline iminopeptidase